MSSADLPPYAAPLDPDDQAVVHTAHAMAAEIHAVLDRHGVDGRRWSDVLEALADLFTWSDGEPED